MMLGCVAFASHAAQPTETVPSTASSGQAALFVGNSYTYFNNVPSLVGALAAASGRTFTATMVVAGGVTLKDHLLRAETRAAMRRTDWSYLVLQEQSSLGRDPRSIVDGIPRISPAREFWLSAETLIGAMSARPGRIVLFATWPRENAAGQLATLTAAYRCLGRRVNANIAPVGSAWEAYRRIGGSGALYQADGSHPTPLGSYLAAIVLYQAIFEAPPSSIPLSVNGPIRDLAGEMVNTQSTTDGIVSGPSTGLLVSVSEQQAAALRRAASEAFAALQQPLSERECSAVE